MNEYRKQKKQNNMLTLMFYHLIIFWQNSSLQKVNLGDSNLNDASSLPL